MIPTVPGLAFAAALAAAEPAIAPPPPPPGMAMGAAPESCPAGAPALPPELAGWASRTPLTAGAAAGSAPELALGRGVNAVLTPTSAVAFPAPPGREVTSPDTLAGLLAFTVAQPGAYAVALSAAAWIDVVDGRGTESASTSHGRGPACSGVRKVVDFSLAPGRYVLQLTGAAPSLGVLVFRR